MMKYTWVPFNKEHSELFNELCLGKDKLMEESVRKDFSFTVNEIQYTARTLASYIRLMPINTSATKL